MVYRKGQRTDKHREAEHPFAVDIPIAGTGLGQNLDLIHAGAKACGGSTDVWGHGTRGPDGTPQRWCRIGTKDESDADHLVRLFSHLNARRAR